MEIIKKLQINISSKIENEIINKKNTFFKEYCDEFIAEVTIYSDFYSITIFDKNNNTLANTKNEFKDKSELFNIIDLYNDDKSILYLVKITKNIELTQLNCSKKINRCFTSAELSNYNPYYDVLYTNFFNNIDFLELCFRLIYMPKIENSWQDLFKLKSDYVGFEIKSKKYKLTEIQDLETKTIDDIIYKVFVITSIFLKRNKYEMESSTFNILKNMAINSYYSYTNEVCCVSLDGLFEE